MKIKNKLSGIVQVLLSKYQGGVDYFDNLDAELLKPENLDIVKELFRPYENHRVVVSGKFGKYVDELVTKGELVCARLYVFNGGLRNGATPELISIRYVTKYIPEETVFIDDSYYQGRTSLAITNFFGNNLTIDEIAVAYNESKDFNIRALFHYYKTLNHE